MQPSPHSLLTSLHPLLNTHSILSSSPPPSKHTGVSPAPPFSVTATKLPRAMAGYPWLYSSSTWTTLTSWWVYSGVLEGRQVWTVMKRCDPPLYSTPYFTSRHGYRMCLRAYLSGDGLGKGTDPSFYFAIVWVLLPWPFCQKIMLTLINVTGTYSWKCHKLWISLPYSL